MIARGDMWSEGGAMSDLRAVPVALLAVCLGAGCAGETAKKQAKGEPVVGRNSPQEIIDTMTGRTAVNSGRKARDIIEKTSVEKNANLEEVYGMGAGE